MSDGFEREKYLAKIMEFPDWPQALFAVDKALEHYARWLQIFAYGDPEPGDPAPPPPSPEALVQIKRVEELRAEIAEDVKLQDGHELLDVRVQGNA